LGRGAGELEEVVLVKINRALVLQDGGLQNRFGRMGQGLFGLGHDARQLGHAGDAVGNVRFLGQRGMGEGQVGAVADVRAIGAGVFFEGMEGFSLPDFGGELVLENFEVNLAVARELGVIHLAGQGGEGGLGEGQPAGAGRGRNVIQLVIPAVVALAGRIQGLLLKVLFKVVVEKPVQLLILGLLSEG